MTTGIANDEKAKVRQLFAEGKVGRDALLESECQSYHGPGTCTFYGTANSNQMMMEIMGLHLPGTAFPRERTFTPVGRMIDEKSIVNAIIGLLATGGSTNHTLHLVAIARAAGIDINWDDFDELSAIIPSLTRVYPNGKADVNHFHAAGGMGFVIRELLAAGLLHEDVDTIVDRGLSAYANEPWLDNGELKWRPAPATSGDDSVLRPAADPFTADGGLRVVSGNLGRAVIKVSAVKPEHRVVEAPAVVFHDQNELLAAFKRGELERDFVAEHSFAVALVTDGRMSGASGKVPAAIHVSPEAVMGGSIGKVRDGDIVKLDANAGTLEVKVPADEWAAREQISADLQHNQFGVGRELFAVFRESADAAEADLARALVDGGIRVLEVTLRTKAALAAMRRMRDEVPGAIVGAGTLRNRAQLEAALDAGAQFGVSPGLTPELASAARNANLTLLPGVATASEAMRAQDE
uniref:2-dehydro-3-deoxy-phosphogluconate aldolase n=1 Tax=Anopheles coluzzii TaxID=1518534 RepID=A0A8W7PCV0_ANOCL